MDGNYNYRKKEQDKVFFLLSPPLQKNRYCFEYSSCCTTIHKEGAMQLIFQHFSKLTRPFTSYTNLVLPLVLLSPDRVSTIDRHFFRIIIADIDIGMPPMMAERFTHEFRAKFSSFLRLSPFTPAPHPSSFSTRNTRLRFILAGRSSSRVYRCLYRR